MASEATGQGQDVTRIFGQTHCAGCGKAWREHSTPFVMGWQLEMTICDGKVYVSDCAPAEPTSGSPL